MLAVARTGLPVDLNIVYLTLTDLRKPLNLDRESLLPHRNCRICGCGFFLWRESEVGCNHSSSWLMSLTRSPFVLSQSSKNSSIVMACGCTPPNSGLLAFLALLFVGRFQVAALLMEYSFGLKRNVSSFDPSTSDRLALPF